VDSLRLSGRETRRLMWAFALSLAAHLLAWGGYEFGRAFNLWRAPAWLRLAEKIQKLPPPAQNSPPPLVFVDVNPEQATVEAPKNAKYYSDKNSRAANPSARQETRQPKLNGTQTEVVKTENVRQPQFSKLEPTPDARRAAQEQEESVPKPTLAPGDLTMASPNNVQRQTQGDAAQERPRTLREAQARQPVNRLPGLEMRQNGGVQRQSVTTSLNVKGTPFGAYDAAFIEAVTQHWYNLLDSQRFALDRTGKVTLQFHLNYDGSITEMKILDNNVGSVLGYICEKAIEDPAPYQKWPSEMRLAFPHDYREVTFTFYYY
jgi:hypothetical protein